MGAVLEATAAGLGQVYARHSPAWLAAATSSAAAALEVTAAALVGTQGDPRRWAALPGTAPYGLGGGG
jgi:hypothetical protein